MLTQAEPDAFGGAEFEVLDVRFHRSFAGFALEGEPLVLILIVAFQRFGNFMPEVVPDPGLSGLRGGISIALTFSLPDAPEKPARLSAT